MWAQSIPHRGTDGYLMKHHLAPLDVASGPRRGGRRRALVTMTLRVTLTALTGCTGADGGTGAVATPGPEALPASLSDQKLRWTRCVTPRPAKGHGEASSQAPRNSESAARDLDLMREAMEGGSGDPMFSLVGIHFDRDEQDRRRALRYTNRTDTCAADSGRPARRRYPTHEPRRATSPPGMCASATAARPRARPGTLRGTQKPRADRRCRRHHHSLGRLIHEGQAYGGYLTGNPA